MANGVVVRDGARVDAAELQAIATLVEAATGTDGVRPLSEKVMAELLADGIADRRHIRLSRDGSLLAYANIDYSDPTRPVVEIAIDPSPEADTAGNLMLDHVGATTAGDIQLWCHGPAAGVPGLAVERGFALCRTLIRMRRDLSGPLPAAELPTGVRVRTFQVGHDESAWLALNSRAFAGLPDQAGWGAEELAARVSAPWFDASGFLLATKTSDSSWVEELVGFHWTKIHADGADAGKGARSKPVGEVYVLGIDPNSQGSGLGKALTLIGLQYLKSCGLESVMLYVESDNKPAIGTYRRLGFRRYATDTLYVQQH